jgi:hypothetical protein
VFGCNVLGCRCLGCVVGLTPSGAVTVDRSRRAVATQLHAADAVAQHGRALPLDLHHDAVRPHGCLQRRLLPQARQQARGREACVLQDAWVCLQLAPRDGAEQRGAARLLGARPQVAGAPVVTSSRGGSREGGWSLVSSSWTRDARATVRGTHTHTCHTHVAARSQRHTHRMRRSASAMAMPHWETSSTCSRDVASSEPSSAPAGAMRKQRLARAPRPTRPRSWCSCARPKREAASTSMTLASGTSTPTSTTVEAMSTWVSPLQGAARIVCGVARERQATRRVCEGRPGPREVHDTWMLHLGSHTARTTRARQPSPRCSSCRAACPRGSRHQTRLQRPQQRPQARAHGRAVGSQQRGAAQQKGRALQATRLPLPPGRARHSGLTQDPLGPCSAWGPWQHAPPPHAPPPHAPDVLRRANSASTARTPSVAASSGLSLTRGHTMYARPPVAISPRIASYTYFSWQGRAGDRGRGFGGKRGQGCQVCAGRRLRARCDDQPQACSRALTCRPRAHLVAPRVVVWHDARGHGCAARGQLLDGAQRQAACDEAGQVQAIRGMWSWSSWGQHRRRRECVWGLRVEAQETPANPHTPAPRQQRCRVAEAVHEWCQCHSPGTRTVLHERQRAWDGCGAHQQRVGRRGQAGAQALALFHA